jgi:hypothetical protein
MTHLTVETLARLVDEAASPEEARHLEKCPSCAAELDTLRDQTEALLHLPALHPPTGSWTSLEDRLAAEGLVRPMRSAAGPASTPWKKIAAALVIFLGGTGVGALATNAGRIPGEMSATSVSLDQVTLEDAENYVRQTQALQLGALMIYGEVLRRDGGDELFADPLVRLALLDHVAAAAEVAVREAPADPFLNGVFVNTVAERQLALDGLALTTANLP